jgi:hypothetical protein
LLPDIQEEDLLDQLCDATDSTQRIEPHTQKFIDTLVSPHPVLARTSVSTTISKAKSPANPVKIPPEFQKYRKVFSDEEAQRLPKHQPWDHKIELIPERHMRKTSVYRLTPQEKQALHEYVTEGLKRGTLRRSEAPDACSFFFIDKKDGKLRPVQDYRPLNDITKKNAAPIPLIPELVDKLLGARFFTKLDVRWGYNNIRLREGDEWKAAFKTPLGLFEPTVMTFGLCNAPATFQTFMDTQFADLIATGKVVIYLDDILIFAETKTELDQLNHRVLQRLQELDLYLRPEKCSFNQPSVEYLGLIISEGELRMDPVKLKAIKDWPRPKTVKDIQKFLGFCNFYRRFVKDYSSKARPLFDLTQKNRPWNWTPPCEHAFTSLQQQLTSAPVLILPDYDKPFTLITDASDYATGAILEQEDALGRSHPVAYYSKSLQPAERNYEIHDKELLAIIQALRHFRHYLQGSSHVTKIFSDHANLQYFTTKQTLTRRQARWSLFLATFDYLIIPKPGKMNKADALSRRPDYKEGIASDNFEKILLTPDKFRIQALRTTAIPTGIDAELKAAIQLALKSDLVTGQKVKDLLLSGPRSATKGLQDWNYEEELLLYKGLVYIPKDAQDLQRKITQQFHDNIMGHPGQWKTLELITREYHWLGMTEFVKQYIQGCAICQTTKIRPPVKVPLKPNEVPDGIWETITMDFITDLPKSQGYDSIFTVVDRHSKAIILSPCNKTITAEQTSQLLIDNVWKRTGFPSAIISDRGPQFAAQVTQEFWRKLGIKQRLSTAFHPQTDGESERVNQEIEQYLRICGNFQQDNWASLLPIIEFAHNARPHRSTHKSPFEVWYGIQPQFKPPLYLQTRLQSVDERVKYLEHIRKEVTAALLIAAREMKHQGPQMSHEFHQGDMVLLEATNLQTTHPKAKLAPKRYGPFKVIWASSTNCKLDLPSSMKVHPVFHNSLLKPYKETQAHGPNFDRPPPEIIAGEEGHYEIEKILAERPTRNRKSTQYLVKWKGYPESDNTWLPAKELTHAQDLLKQFKNHGKTIQALQAQRDPKEGILSRAKPASPRKPTSYAQVLKSLALNQHVTRATGPARDPIPRSPRDHGTPHVIKQHVIQSQGLARALPRDQTRSRDEIRFGHATRPLPSIWKTVGKSPRASRA